MTPRAFASGLEVRETAGDVGGRRLAKSFPMTGLPSVDSTLVRLPVLDAAITAVDSVMAVTLPTEAAESRTAQVESVFGDEGRPSFARRYEPGALLGEGGMGRVCLASDRRIGRDVAMKTMIADAAGRSERAARFLREACVQGQLEHPAIVPVYDLGRDPSGDLYFTMKRVRGETFADIVDRLRAHDADAERQFSRRKRLTAFASVCQAVHFAHTHGVVHRDLKPANVMLGDFGEVYVLDWGIAKIIGSSDPGEPVSGARPTVPADCDLQGHTLAGSTMGTLGYMAPEQLQAGGQIDGRADVYALGAILFELVALEPLHAKGAVEAVATSTLRGVDARPSLRAAGLDVAPELDAICVKATALDPRDRFSTVRELVDALESYLDGDRDVERRRSLAAEHAARAAAAAALALEDGASAIDARREALFHVGRALALDATNGDAMSTLLDLLARPPRDLPAEAREEVEASSRRKRRAVARGATLGYLGYLAIALAAGTTSMIFGPYVLVPTLAMVNVVLWLLLPQRTHRLTILGLSWLTVLVPAVLEWTNVVRFYRFRPETPIHAVLFGASLVLVSVAALLVTRFRDELTRSETQSHLHTWQLRQLAGPTRT
jgi:serine/threonine-protein kinase